MSGGVLLIWRVLYHFERPLNTGIPTPSVVQMNLLTDSQSANVVAPTGDPAGIASVLAANGITAPPGSVMVLDLISQESSAWTA